MKALKCAKKCLFHHFQLKESNLFIINRHIHRISPYIPCIHPYFSAYYTAFSVFFCIFKIILIDSHDITYFHTPFTSNLVQYIHLSHINHKYHINNIHFLPHHAPHQPFIHKAVFRKLPLLSAIFRCIYLLQCNQQQGKQQKTNPCKKRRYDL